MHLYGFFAEILDYPGAQLPSTVEGCVALLTLESPETAGMLQRFQRYQSAVSLGELQEAYTSIFDMQPECTLNLGYQLLGDDWRRSILLFKLKEMYQANNFDCGCELPDHLCVLLRFLAILKNSSEAADLVDDCVLPTLSRMASSIQLGESPYRWVLHALLSWLGEQRKALGSNYVGRDGQQVAAAIMGGEERTA
ncbi:MAG: nitrate reductase molybdenum cofactor assembly chaperone [Acidobacteriaceae bacterium]